MAAIGTEPSSQPASSRCSLDKKLDKGAVEDLDGELLLDRDEYEEEQFDEIYDVVDAVVPRYDDPAMPAMTFRVLVLGTIMCISFAFVNTILSFRTNPLVASPILGVLLAYPVGIFMARVLPTTVFKLAGFEFSLNPGPFNFKEHALIYVWASSGQGSGAGNAYAMYNIIGQKYKLGQDLSTVSAIFFTATTNVFGFGMAGLCRRYLVRPAAMLWPSTLSTIAMLNSLHGEVKIEQDIYSTSRFKFFWLATLGMGLYQFLPSVVAPVLTTFSLLCYIAPATPYPKLSKFFGSASPGGGVGMLSLTFDWQIIASLAPITSPLWAVLNQMAGYWLLLWVIVPIMWSKSVFGMDRKLGSNEGQGPNGTGQFPHGMVLNSPALFDRTGKRFSASTLTYKGNLTLNDAVYDKLKPIYLTTSFAMDYMTSFMVFTGAISHVSLWYGRDVWHRFRTGIRDLDTADIHARLMDAYPEVPDLWYIVTMASNLAISIFVCQFGGFDLAWWGVLLALGIAFIGILPIGIIIAISGQSIGLNVIAEFLVGLILPGHIAAVMTFKTLSTMALSQGLSMVQDLKIAHYLKVPPRAMFLSQLIATLIVGTINVFMSFFVYEAFGRDNSRVPGTCQLQYPLDPFNPNSAGVWRLDSPNSPYGWSANGYSVFFNSGTVWGAIGPARFFGPGSPYPWILSGFLIGAVGPIFPYVMHRLFPNGYWHLVNFVLIILMPGDGTGSARSDMISPLVVAIAVNYFVKKYRHTWWKKYAYVMSAAFDSGSAIAITVIFFAFQFNQSYQISMTPWWGNPGDGENCAPYFYLRCTENANIGSSFNRTYDITQDEFCSSINFQDSLSSACVDEIGNLISASANNFGCVLYAQWNNITLQPSLQEAFSNISLLQC